MNIVIQPSGGLSMSKKPTVIHIVNHGGRLCGKKFEGEWAAKYTTDEFASTLPLCPDCIEAGGPQEIPTSSQPPDLSDLFGVDDVVEEMIDYTKQMSLREWCK